MILIRGSGPSQYNITSASSLRRWNVLRVYLSEESALITTAHPGANSNYSAPLIVLKSGPADRAARVLQKDNGGRREFV